MKRFWWALALALWLLTGCSPRPAVQEPPMPLVLSTPDAAESETKVGSSASTYQAAVGAGLVVERVPETSALWKAGIRKGDVLFSWKSLSTPTTGAVLVSPFDWHYLEIEQGNRGMIQIEGERDGERRTYDVPMGTWESAVRPQLDGENLSIYRHGQELIEDQKISEGVEHWGRLVESFKRDHERRWLQSQIARRLAQAQSWTEAEKAYATSKSGASCLVRHGIALELGRTSERSRRLDLAEAAYREAGECAGEIHPGGLLVANSLNGIGGIAIRRGEISKAEGFLREALVIGQQLAPDSMIVAATLNRLGIIAFNRGDYEGAEKLYEEALRIRESLAPTTLAVSTLLNNLGIIARRRGDLDRATELFEETLAIDRALAPDSLGVAATLDNLGLLEHQRDDLGKALKYNEEALEIRMRLAPSSLAVANSLNHLGMVRSRQGAWDMAAHLYEESLAIREELAPGSLFVAGTLHNLGNVLIRRGEFSRASELLSEALKIYRAKAPESSDIAAILNSISSIASQSGDLNRATEVQEEALALGKRNDANSLTVALTLHNLGIGFEVNGDLPQAVASYEKSLAIKRSQAPGSLTEADTLGALGSLALDQNNPVLAARYFQQSLKIRETVGAEDFYMAEDLKYLGHAARIAAKLSGDLGEQTAELNRAYEFYIRALKILEGQVRKVGGSYDAQAEFRFLYDDYYDDVISLLLSQKRSVEAFEILERFRAQIFLKMLTERDIAFSRDIPSQLDQERRKLHLRIEATQNQLADLNPDEDDSEIQEVHLRLEQLYSRAGDLEARIRLTSPKLAALRYPVPLTFRQSQEALDRGTLVVAMTAGAKHLSIFTFSQNLPVKVTTVDLGLADLREKIDRFNATFSEYKPGLSVSKRSSATSYSLGRELYDLLLKSAEPEIEKHERLLILPDGPLNSLPFGALLRKDAHQRESYLVEWRPFHVALSVTAYAEIKKQRRGTENSPSSLGPLAIFGDPIYPQSPRDEEPKKEGRGVSLTDPVLRSVARRDGIGFEWSPLPYTRHEVEGIAEVFNQKDTRKFFGPNALEESIKDLEPGIRILHLATHAYSNDRIPLSSFVALSIPADLSKDRDNGLLQAWEILEQVRVDLDLLVLSGCTTALGQEIRGEGLIGLVRAFQYAGARSVLASLWNVNDRSTAELMIRFYKHLTSGLAKDEALRAAQMELIRGPIKIESENGEMIEVDYSSPYHWAAFQVYGDWK